MRIAVVSANAAKESASKLAEGIGARFFNLAEDSKRDFSFFDVLFNYGTSFRPFRFKNIINKISSVATCIDKVRTLNILRAAGIPTVEFTTDKEEARKWSIVATRSTATGKSGEGLGWWYKSSKKRLPEAVFYSNYFPHKFEIRVIVFKNEVAAKYIKKDEDGGTSFLAVPKKRFASIESACIAAAQALDIDYVGFDVLYESPSKFAILEANTGPIITEEVITFIKEKLK